MEPKKITVRRWSELSSAPLSEERVRALRPRQWNYRVSLNKHEPGTTFDGLMSAGECFVLTGSFRIAFGEKVVKLVAGDVAALPQGSYRVVVPQEAGVVYLLAWDLAKLLAKLK
ncbi:hypothetical protein MYSTI_07798 [Myxococcus stipitatus DSM 14675]|uniref:Cupin domain-containing protein n=1 Tax=Myxococcus stipitatus (strain DSM 14675 / JCM 12634 / Mx s8) TaxID=1278073 RepID=L7UMG0_MYXSD|nr:hypothetical protein [Myxococcus stipitatus]AGC49070.1 hypothetical protein MYSTI_07798 [Myxococcus stipitatus DSM 14675]